MRNHARESFFFLVPSLLRASERRHGSVRTRLRARKKKSKRSKAGKREDAGDDAPYRG